MPKTVVKTWKSSVDPSAYPTGGAFGNLLAWHLAWGTRPGCSVDEPNQPWVKSQFAQLVHEEGLDVKSSVRSLRNWTKHNRLPDAQDTDKVRRVFEELFGNDPNLWHWKDDLEDALDRGRKQKASRIAGREIVEPRGVPQPSYHFMGRADDVDKLATMLTSLGGSLPALVQGGPGIGKTELTKAVAHDNRVAARFRQRRWFVSLETATSAEAMQRAIIRAVGCDPMSDFEAALDILRENPALLVLDNLETPWEPITERNATEETLANLAAVPGISLLASMRGQEWVRRPKWLPHPLPVLSHESASEFFAAIVGSWVQDDPILDDFLTALGGLPLAIELVARRAYGRDTLEHLWHEWLRIGSDLAVDRDYAAGRLSSLPWSIELSLQSISAPSPTSQLFSFLGMADEGLTRENCDALVGNGAFDAEEDLLRAGLAIRRFGRLQLLPPIREHACRHRPLGENDESKWKDYFLNRIVEASSGKQTVEAPEHHYMGSTLIALARSGRFDEATESLGPFIRIGRPWHNDTPETLEALVGIFEASDQPAALADCLFRLAHVYRVSMNHAEAIEAAERARRLFHARREYEDEIDALRTIALCEAERHEAHCAQDIIDEDEEDLPPRCEQVRAALDKAIAIAKCHRMQDDEALCQRDLASFEFYMGEYEKAQQIYHRARMAYEEIDDRVNMERCSRSTEQRMNDDECEFVHFVLNILWRDGY